MATLTSAYSSFTGLRRDKTAKKETILGYIMYCLLFLSVVVMAFLLYIWYPLEIVETGYSIQKLYELRSTMKAENNRLKLEYASLASPARIQYIARKKLGMVEPGIEQIFILPSQ